MRSSLSSSHALLEMKCDMQISYEMVSLSSCVQKPEKVRTLTGFEPVTSRYRCDAVTN